MEKLKRQMKRFMNVGKRNVGMPDEFGGGVQTSPKELVKPIKPKKEGAVAKKKRTRVADSTKDAPGGSTYNPSTGGFQPHPWPGPRKPGIGSDPYIDDSKVNEKDYQRLKKKFGLT